MPTKQRCELSEDKRKFSFRDGENAYSATGSPALVREAAKLYLEAYYPKALKKHDADSPFLQTIAAQITACGGVVPP